MAIILLWLLLISIPFIATEPCYCTCYKLVFRSFAREDAPVLPLFVVLPSFCSSPTAGRVSISWRSHVGAWPGEVLSEQPKIKNLPLGVGSAASLWNCQLNPRSCPSLPRVAPARQRHAGFQQPLACQDAARSLAAVTNKESISRQRQRTSRPLQIYHISQ